MNTLKILLVLLLLLLLAFSLLGLPRRAEAAAEDPQSDRLYTRRLALLVGANNGGKDRVLLRYAVDDARAVGKVLEDMGGVLSGDSRYLENPSRDTMLGALRALAADAEKAKETSRRVEVILYYSGHSDEEALFLGEERLPYAELKEAVRALKADVRIAIFDSCASGAMTLPKGVIKRPPFLLDTAYDMKGYAFMTSSSAGEAAQESSRLGRSFFTHNLISGMRGAADMNLDGRITLNEAYQFAFDGTLMQTERTMAGVQHPSRHIEMSGTGDVVITEIWKSAAVLTFEPAFAGKVYVHGKDGFLLVEMNKAAGREVSIGLDAGDYRVFADLGGKAVQSRISLVNGKSVELGRADFAKASRIPAVLRGRTSSGSGGAIRGPGRLNWRVELTGGLAAINPVDLNMRGTYDQMNSAFYGHDYLAYRVSRGEIASFVRRTEGDGLRQLRLSAPFGIQVRRRLASWLDVSVGFSRFAGSRISSRADFYEVTGLDGARTTFTDRLDDYTLAVKGFLPAAGIHIGGNIAPSLRLEAGFSGGPLFAQCRYAIHFQSNFPAPGSDAAGETPEQGMIEEKGRGVSPAFNMAAKLDYSLSRRRGVFIEGGYNFQMVRDIAGPGTRTSTGHRDTWEGEWAMKQMVTVEPWGTGRFLWPSNAWVIFGGKWWQAREFELDLSGFQLKAGFYVRF